MLSSPNPITPETYEAITKAVEAWYHRQDEIKEKPDKIKDGICIGYTHLIGWILGIPPSDILGALESGQLRQMKAVKRKR